MPVVKPFKKTLAQNRQQNDKLKRADNNPTQKKQTQKKYTQDLWQNFIETVELKSTQNRISLEKFSSWISRGKMVYSTKLLVLLTRQ